jgi:hypothetical protein
MNLLERAITRKSAALAQLRQTEALVGFEFEFAVPDDSDLYSETGINAETGRLSSISEVEELSNFFEMDRTDISNMEREYDEWVEAAKQEWVDENWEKYAVDDEEDADERENQARQTAMDEAKGNLDLEQTDWVDSEYGSWYRLIIDNGFAPRYGWESEYGGVIGSRADRSTFYMSEIAEGGDQTRANVANELEKLVGSQVLTHGSGTYKSWKVVDDSSIREGHGAEIISPPLPWAEGKEWLKQITEFAQDHGFQTNESTGLHINISVPNIKNIDLVKFVVFLDDEFALEVFGRSSNTYAQSQTQDILSSFVDHVRGGGSYKDLDFKGLRELARAGMKKQKYRSVNIGKLFEHGYLELRIAGGDYLSKIPETEKFMDRIIIALDVAMDETAERDKYAKKLFKLFDRGTARVTPIAARRTSISSLYGSTPSALSKFLKLDTELLPKAQAVEYANDLVVLLAQALEKLNIQRLSSAQAGELIKLFKKNQLSIADVASAGASEALKRLGLRK